METIKIDKIGIGLKLSKLRQAQNMTQAEVGREFGESRKRIWQYENGVALTLGNITKLAKFYGKTVDYFVSGE